MRKDAKELIQMTGDRCILDTNIIISWLKGSIKIATRIDEADIIYLPVIVLGELYYGANYSTNAAKHKNDIRRIIPFFNIVSLDENSPVIYGQIKSDLRKKGTPIPENDLWIATICIQNNLQLVTNDHHFHHIENLKTIKW